MTRNLLLADVHANLAALETVLSVASDSGPIDEVWSLGDAVGYGPQPSECALRLKEAHAVAVLGNHELAALGRIPLEDFNPYARRAAEWTTAALTSDAREYLEQMPSRLTSGRFTLVHGSPRHPEWEYIDDPAIAEECLPFLESPHCVYGHTHLPAAYAMSDARPPSAHTAQSLVSIGEPGLRWFINPGSVGQPRDRDPRAAYAILDTEVGSVEFARVEYPIEVTQKLMTEAGLPTMLVERLSSGF